MAVQSHRNGEVVAERSVPVAGVVGATAAAAGVGAAVEYVLDPDRGHARRARLRDKAVHAAVALNHGGRVLGRDMSGRGRGMAAGFRYLTASRHAADDVLHERVRAELGRYVSHPHSVGVDVEDAVVSLTGAVLAGEDRRACRAVRRVPGVRSVRADWRVHSAATGVSELQGNGRPRVPTIELMQQRWSPTARFLVGSTVLATFALSRRAPAPLAWALRGAGTVVGVRSVTNLPLKRLTGVRAGRDAVRVQAAVCVAAPPEAVWPVVSDYSAFPKFARDVRAVRRSADGTLSHWEINGPGGLPVRFDAEETAREDGTRIAWQTRDGQQVAHTGTLRIDPVGDGRTRVQVQLTYNPVAGAIGHAIATALGANPTRRLHDALRQLKAGVEARQ